VFSDNNEDCDATKMVVTEEPLIYIRTVLPSDKINVDSDISYKLPDATHLQISGSIQKVYCSGKKSGYFSFSHNIYPGDYTSVELESGVFMLQPYQYKFQNDKDKLIVIITYKAWFNDGKIFESHTFTDEFFFKDIRYEGSQMKYYIKLDDHKDNSQWREVTS